jgi:hypothetical protein
VRRVQQAQLTQAARDQVHAARPHRRFVGRRNRRRDEPFDEPLAVAQRDGALVPWCSAFTRQRIQ